MGKNLQRMRKGNLVGYGVGVASLLLSGVILTSCHKEINNLENTNDNLVKEVKDLTYENTELVELKNSLEDSIEIKSNELKTLEMRLNEEVEKNKEISKQFETEKKKVLQYEAELKNSAKVSSSSSTKKGSWKTFTQTHYISFCYKCSGKTASGISVRNTIKYKGYSIIAVDPRIIPLGSIVQINDGTKTFKAIALDTGGKIKGNKIDLLVSTNNNKLAYSLGVKKIQLSVLRKGWG